MRFRLLISLAFAAALFGAKKPITIDDVLAYYASPGPEPVWSPDGKSFAYEEDGALFRYDIRHRHAKELLQLSTLEAIAKPAPETKPYVWRDREVVDHKLQWFPNGADLLVYIKHDLFILHASGEYEQVTTATQSVEAPLLAPDGNAVLYRSSHNLYILDVRTRQSRQLTQDGTPMLLNGELDWVYPEELEIPQAAWWSPDSKSIAYLQFNVSDELQYPQTDLLGRRAIYEPERYPQAGTPNAKVKLGIIPAQGGTTVWMHAGDNPDVLLARVAWFPDSSAVALETMPRLQNRLYLLRCDPVTGAVTTLIEEQSKDWINLSNNLYLLKSRPEFLWSSERSGFHHIYRYSMDGKQIAQLTSGDWEVRGIAAVDEHSGRVFFTGDEETPLETHLYSMPIEGGRWTQLTRSGFTHTVRMSEAGNYFVDSYSNVVTPPRSVLDTHTGDQVAVLKTNENVAADYDFHAPEISSFRGSDGMLFYTRLTKPKDFDPAKTWPAVVYVYGGPGAQQVRNAWSGLNWEQVLAERGYVVWEMDNRGSTGRGHAFETSIFHRFGEQEVADQRAGVEHLISAGFVDPKRIGITGWSFGGYMTIHGMLLAPSIFKVGVAGAPVTDWRNYDTIYTERYMGLPAENADAYDDASNVENANLLQGHLLIVHNLEDDNVLFQNTAQFVNALEDEDKPYSLAVYGQKTHHVAGKVQKQMYEEMTGFFDRNLK